jgi:hypothetical protein
VNLYITDYCRIADSKVYLNGLTAFEQPEATDVSLFLKEAFKHFNCNYAKFYKMDALSKLAFLAAEFCITDNITGGGYSAEQLAVILFNASSSLNTDVSFHNSIIDDADFFPSPAVFVYTLPNIMAGEICIRHKIMGESTVFIQKEFDPASMVQMVQSILRKETTQACLTGWVELDKDTKRYDARLFFVEKTDKKLRNINFEPNVIQNL